MNWFLRSIPARRSFPLDPPTCIHFIGTGVNESLNSPVILSDALVERVNKSEHALICSTVDPRSALDGFRLSLRRSWPSAKLRPCTLYILVILKYLFFAGG